MSAASLPLAEPAANEIIIRPPGKWASLELRDVWEYRELLYFLAKRELQIRYKQSVIGVAWAVIQPLAYALIFTLFFGRLADLPSEGVPYPLFALAGLAPWLFTSQGVSQSAESLIRDANLLSKVYFPRIVLPVAKVLSFLVDLAIALGVVALFMAIYGVRPSSGLALLPLFLLLAAMTAVSVGMLLGALNVQYRDVTLIVPLLLQLWLFATPVIYPGSLIHGTLQYVYAINPMVTVVQGTRWALLGTPAPAGLAAAVSVATAFVLAVGALIYFRRTERFFADVI